MVGFDGVNSILNIAQYNPLGGFRLSSKFLPKKLENSYYKKMFEIIYSGFNFSAHLVESNFL